MSSSEEYQDLMRRLQYEQDQQRDDVPFPPQQIFELAKKHPIVNSLVERWRMGELTWEQALSGMVVYLCATNESLFEQLTKAVVQNPAPVKVFVEMVELLKKQSEP